MPEKDPAPVKRAAKKGGGATKRVVRKKRRPRRKKRRRLPFSPELVKALIGGVVVGLVFWVFFVTAEDRHWSAFYEAGERAAGRGNYTYAEKMYREALQEADRLDPKGDKVIQTLEAMARLYTELGQQDLARSARQRAAALKAAGR